ncbi:MAG: CehA/McbA family metallohydrolase [Deltaproteobacteria bacterium]|nr:CehA/McbA family metallohydrolase [Deltaproteobacteria bacterium]
MHRYALVLSLCGALGCGPVGAQRAALLADLRREPVTGTPPGEDPVDADGWHLALFHVHSAEGPYEARTRDALSTRDNANPARARQALRLAASYGITALFLTDHNSLDAALDRATVESAHARGISLVPGSEYSLGGPLAFNLPITLGQAGPHFSFVGYAAKRPGDALVPADTRARPSAGEWAALVEEVHARGGAVVLSHPSALNANWPGDAPPPADLVEVDGPLVHSPAAARARWHEWLMQGVRMGAISGADWHVGVYPAAPFTHLNLVRAPSRTPAALAEALRAGHLMVVTQAAKRPRVLLGADADGDGVFDDAREGDVLIPAPGSQRVRFQARAVGARGLALVLYTQVSREPVHKLTLHDSDEVRAWSMALPEDGRAFVRAELWDGPHLRVLTNPLYFDPAPPGPRAGGSP